MSKNQQKPINPEMDQDDVKDEASKEPEKPNVFKRGWDKVKGIPKAIKDNPVASAVCAVAGAIATVGVGLFLESRKQSNYISIPAQTDDEPVELDEAYDEAPAEEAEVE